MLHKCSDVSQSLKATLSDCIPVLPPLIVLAMFYLSQPEYDVVAS